MSASTRPSTAFRPRCAGSSPKACPFFSPWQLLEHLRLAQFDILDFCRNPDYTEGVWPDDYWPETSAPPNPEAWDANIAQFRADRQVHR